MTARFSSVAETTVHSKCRQLERWAEAGLDQMVLVLQAGNTTHQQVMESVDLLGRRVIPHFRSGEAAVA